MNKPLVICLLVLSNLTLNLAMASVSVIINQEEYTYTHQPRLAEILAPIANKKNWYWPSATLYRANHDTQLEDTRKLINNNLSKLIEKYQTETSEISQPLQLLKTTITSWRLAKRLPTTIDFDLARIVAANNPQLPHGDYKLALKPRMNTIQLFGAVNKTVNMAHLSHADVSQYMTSQNTTGLADKDYVVLIQADGRVINVPIAYWNKNHQEAMPGSQIYIPFKTSIFHPEFALINQKIITLALNRIQ